MVRILLLLSILITSAMTEVKAQFMFGPGVSVEDAGRAGYADGLCVRAIGELVNYRFSEAHKYYAKAYNEYNSAEAAAHLGLMYEVGMGVTANHDKAWKFYSWAKSKGNQLAAACIYRINNEGYWEATNENRKMVIAKLRVAHGMNSGGAYSAPNVGYGSSSSSSSSHKKCGSCGGSGLCTGCNGQGGYWEEVGYLSGHPKQIYTTCPVCRGNKHCGVCRGNGYIY